MWPQEGQHLREGRGLVLLGDAVPYLVEEIVEEHVWVLVIGESVLQIYKVLKQ